MWLERGAWRMFLFLILSQCCQKLFRRYRTFLANFSKSRTISPHTYVANHAQIPHIVKMMKNAQGNFFYAIFMPQFFTNFWSVRFFSKSDKKNSSKVDILLNKFQINQITHIWAKNRTTAHQQFFTRTRVQITHKLAVSRTFWQLWGFVL